MRDVVAPEVVRAHVRDQLTDPRVHVLAVVLCDATGEVAVYTFAAPSAELVEVLASAAQAHLALLDTGESPCG